VKGKKNKKVDTDKSLISLLEEVKTVLLQLDNRHNGHCYNPLEENCSCTLCKINNVLETSEK
jgi:hypothetical protein